MLHFYGLLSKFSVASAKLIELHRFRFGAIEDTICQIGIIIFNFPHSDFAPVNNIVKMYETAIGIIVDFSL